MLTLSEAEKIIAAATDAIRAKKAFTKVEAEIPGVSPAWEKALENFDQAYAHFCKLVYEKVEFENG